MRYLLKALLILIAPQDEEIYIFTGIIIVLSVAVQAFYYICDPVFTVDWFRCR